MKKETLFLWIIAVLVLVNALQVGAFLIKPKPPRPSEHHHQDFRERAVEILNLTKKQKEQFFTLAEKHSAEIHKLNQDANSLSAAYFDNPTEEGLNSILSIQSKKIELTEDHFIEIKSILTKEQLPKYEKFKKEAIQIILR